MKGHVGGGPGPEEFKASGIRQAKPFYVLLHIHSICDVQERLLEAGLGCFSVFPEGADGRTLT